MSILHFPLATIPVRRNVLPSCCRSMSTLRVSSMGEPAASRENRAHSVCPKKRMALAHHFAYQPGCFLKTARLFRRWGHGLAVKTSLIKRSGIVRRGRTGYHGNPNRRLQVSIPVFVNFLTIRVICHYTQWGKFTGTISFGSCCCAQFTGTMSFRVRKTSIGFQGPCQLGSSPCPGPINFLGTLLPIDTHMKKRL